MAKFDKDVFLSEMADKVKDAIESGLISQNDIDNNDVSRLTGFLQYALSDYIEDRKSAIDILRDFNYDERYAWEALEEQIGGKIKSLFDVALANLWKFLEASGLLAYAYYIDGVSPEATKPNVEVDYQDSEFDDEFEDEFELDGEIKDEDDFDEEDSEDELEEEPIEKEDMDESFEDLDKYDYLNDEDDEDDFRYKEMIRRRSASNRRSFRRER